MKKLLLAIFIALASGPVVIENVVAMRPSGPSRWDSDAVSPVFPVIAPKCGCGKPCKVKAAGTYWGKCDKNCNGMPQAAPSQAVVPSNEIRFYFNDDPNKTSLIGQPDQYGSTLDPAYYFLGNYFGSLLTINNAKFHTAEAAFQWGKLKYLLPQFVGEKTKLENDLINTQEGYKVWKIGQELNAKIDIKEWHKNSINHLRTVLEAKFTQNLALKRQLIATGNHTLIEYCPDKFYGWHDQINPNGENKLGQLLMELRGNFTGKPYIISSSTSQKLSYTARLVVTGLALGGIAFASWYFGYYLPEQQRIAAEKVAECAAKWWFNRC